MDRTSNTMQMPKGWDNDNQGNRYYSNNEMQASQWTAPEGSTGGSTQSNSFIKDTNDEICSKCGLYTYTNDLWMRKCECSSSAPLDQTFMAPTAPVFVPSSFFQGISVPPPPPGSLSPSTCVFKQGVTWQPLLVSEGIASITPLAEPV